MNAETSSIPSPEAVQAECLSQLGIWESRSRSGFSWPMDRVAGQPYGYAIHVAIADAWNEEGRISSCADFHRAWLSDLGNIRKALVCP